MLDFLSALGLVLAIEGLFFAAFPDAARRALAEAANSESGFLRWAGVISACAGVAIVFLARYILA